MAYYAGNQYSYQAGYDQNETARLWSFFSTRAGADQRLDRQEFFYVFQQLHPQVSSNPYFYQILEQTFESIDTNRSGRINFQEFLQAYGRLRVYFVQQPVFGIYQPQQQQQLFPQQTFGCQQPCSGFPYLQQQYFRPAVLPQPYQVAPQFPRSGLQRQLPLCPAGVVAQRPAFLPPQPAFLPPQPAFVPQQPAFFPTQPVFLPQQPVAAVGVQAGYDQNDTARLYNFFSSRAGADQRLDRQEFFYVFQQLHPQVSINPYFYQILEQTFETIDTNRSGRINFQEFLQAYGRLRYYLVQYPAY